METKSELLLRVNGISITDVNLRHPAVDGYIQTNRYEVVITDPVIGDFALTQECFIEVREARTRKHWKEITLAELISILAPR
jgi:hypothetical protein